MKKKRNRKTGIYLGARILSALLTVLLILNTAVFAYTDEADLPRVIPHNTAKQHKDTHGRHEHLSCDKRSCRPDVSAVR